ncbi:hypothetical protein B2D07_16075 [Desulfococcus multivorans]|uniref:Uncharacterized protein n=1 Tax=Desulfococcus multivorans DSM 2059 TaxID=1121405 RepID=S7UUE0_DESML|nr:conserved uncharacterized protein [Desulfococcus multivorans]AQV02127.1 hypothetical protein B2D07_16075 [Desulfococcus multivorans]EPR35978.1 hypothetical protein dsmv_0683 [Desulfococcus multivorans DSM 2059]SJZ36130.1 hypothetical protein SAMN02745446_00201 [Desulfococcus multivorans DSM 2059]
MNPAAAEIARLQDPDGCFPSEVLDREGRRPDCNGFTTALVLRQLRHLPDEVLPTRTYSAALDFLESCRSSQLEGAFGFRPETQRPAWAPRLPADLDDTAILTLELLRAGRISRRAGLRTVLTVLVPHRFSGRTGEIYPPWVMPGAFLTWVGKPGRRNVIDCCVNANAAALMARVGGAGLPGYAEAVGTITQGVAWAGGQPSRQQAVTPFYPSIHGLHEAVEHAVECGVTDLGPTLARLRELAAGAPPARGCCCSAYGGTVWSCPALVAAQALRRIQMSA